MVATNFFPPLLEVCSPPFIKSSEEAEFHQKCFCGKRPPEIKLKHEGFVCAKKYTANVELRGLVDVSQHMLQNTNQGVYTLKICPHQF